MIVTPRSFLGPRVVGILADEQGVVLITVLFVTGLVALIAVSMVNSQQIDIRRTANIVDAGQAQALARGGEVWATRLLARDQKKSSRDHLGEEWARGLPPVPVEGGQVAGMIIDLQGRFNVNNLVAGNRGLRERSRQQFARLLGMCQLTPMVLESVTDWLDNDEDQGRAEDWAYANLEVPYRTANQPMISPSELRLVQGMTTQGYQCLESLVSTLPVGTGLNINTAPAEILASLADEISLSQGEYMAKQRPREGYGQVADFLAEPDWAGTGLAEDGLTVQSDFFLARIHATVGRGNIVLWSLIGRQGDGVKVLQRTMGAL